MAYDGRSYLEVLLTNLKPQSERFSVEDMLRREFARAELKRAAHAAYLRSKKARRLAKDVEIKEMFVEALDLMSSVTKSAKPYGNRYSHLRSMRAVVKGGSYGLSGLVVPVRH